MHRALFRQLKRVTGVADEAALEAFLAEVREFSGQPGLPSQIAGLLAGLGDFVSRIDSSYQQYERDLALRTRSMELSSQELSEANARLRTELSSRDRALKSLRETAGGLLSFDGAADSAAALADNDLESLSILMARLIEQRELERRELDNQKFALDQHAIVSITDTSGVILYANERFCEISGYTQDELIGKSHRIVKSGQHPPEVFADMWATISSGKVWHGEICNRKKSGGFYWVSATIVPFLDASGLPTRYIGIRTDITERKAMETQLQEQLRLVEELIEAIPLPLYLKDVEGRYLRLNRAFEEFVGVRRADFLGKTVSDLLPPEQARLHLEKDAELCAAGGSQMYEADVHSRDGSSHQTIYRKAVLTRPDGSVSGLVGTIIDITERKEAEQTLRRAMEAAEAANRAKSDFLANMSHEIRTPMNGVIGMTDLALGTRLDDEPREYLQIVKSSAESLLTIINDILDFSKIEAGKLMIETVSFQLQRLIAEATRTLALRAHEKGLELVLDIDAKVPHFVLGDPGRLRQVLINLVSNAVKFTERGEIVIRVGLGREIGGVQAIRFAVTDTGIGIAADKLSHIFDAFTQEDTSITRRFGGTGLGLTISARLVSMMGGRLDVDSQPGAGSTFHFELPLATDAQREDIPETPVDLRNLQVLVVDDNVTNQVVLTRLLMSWGMQASTVGSGAAALEWLAAGHPVDLIILDAHMPEMDGFELAERIQANPALSRCPRIMLSSGAARGDGERCRQAGIAAYFGKPIAQQELLAGLHSVLGVGETRPAAAADLVTRHSLREARHELSVLLVEDHAVNQKLAISLLEKWGHRVTLANNGEEAIALATRENFDVILMDLQMPVMGGLEATQRLRMAGCTTRIVAMTANAMEGDRELCLAAGMDDYLSKPIKADDLFSRLHRAAGNKPTGGDVKPGYDYAGALRRVDQEVLEIVAGLFLEAYGDDLASLREAMAAGDLPVIRRVAHTIRGIVGNFMAEPLVELTRRMEDAAHRGDLDSAASLLAPFETELALLVGALQATQGTAATGS